MKTCIFFRAAQKINILTPLYGVFLSLMLLPCLSGCKKDLGDSNEPGGSYYVKFKVDGKQEEFRYLKEGQLAIVTATEKDENGNYSVFGSFMKTIETTSQNTISLLLGYSELPATDKVYGNFNSTVAGAIKAPVLIISYTDNDGDDYLTSLFDVSSGPYDAQVAFSHISAKEIKGTFSGTLRQVKDGYTEKTIKITDGVFFAPRIM